jgi:hypothetical protein
VSNIITLNEELDLRWRTATVMAKCTPTEIFNLLRDYETIHYERGRADAFAKMARKDFANG